MSKIFFLILFLVASGLFGQAKDVDPSFQFWLGAVDPKSVEESKKNKEPLPSLHSSLFAPVPESKIKTGIRAMTAAVLNLLQPR